MTRYIKVIILILIVLSISGIAFARPVEIETKVDKDTITIGDRVKYEVILRYDEGVEIEPLTVAENLGEFEIKDYKIEEPKRIDDKLISRITYIITTFTTGEFILPPLKVKYKDAEGNEKELSSKKITITVESVIRPTDKDDIRPLKRFALIKERFPIWILILLLLLIISTIIVVIYLKKKEHIEKEPPTPPRPPEEIAMEELQDLLKSTLIEKGMIKEYYIRMSDVIRKYIEGRYKIFALDRTTWELYQEMRLRKIERMHVDKIRDFLEDCDLVKFAKYIPTKGEMDEAYNRAKEIINMTIS